MKSVDLIIYDLDGTLIDSREDIAQASNKMLMELGLKKKSADEIAECVGRGVQNLVLGLLGKDHEDKFEKALKLVKKHYGNHLLDHTKLYPGVQETLEHFKGKKQVVITNKPEGFSVKILEGLKIAHYFERIIGGDTARTKKPSPESIFKILDELKISADRAIIVGDSAIDIETGKNAKVAVCAVIYGFGRLDEIQNAKPDFTIKQFNELMRIVKRG